MKCVEFCALPARTAGSDVHAEWCVSEPIGFEVVAGTENDADSVEMTVDMIGHAASGQRRVRLTGDVSAGGGWVATVRPADARSLAAALLRAADLVETLVS